MKGSEIMKIKLLNIGKINQDESAVKCVTGSLEEIYVKLARPLQTLENLRYAEND